jgi:hypothetical protein
MLSGIKEVVIVVCVLVGLFMLPRFIRLGGSKSASGEGQKQPGRKIQGLMRIAILFSVLWVVGAAVLLNPSSGRILPFLGGGVLPVAMGWGIRWVVLGFK